jgi:hypothetical protein
MHREIAAPFVNCPYREKMRLTDTRVRMVRKKKRHSQLHAPAAKIAAYRGKTNRPSSQLRGPSKLYQAFSEALCDHERMTANGTRRGYHYFGSS